MYPMLREDVSLRICKSKRSYKLHYLIKNGDDEEFEISHRLYDALLEADGTKPLNLPDKGKKVISRLKKDKLIYTSRVIHLGGPLFGLILLPVGNRVRKVRWIFKLLNAALPVVSVIVLAVSVILKLFCNTYSDYAAHYELIYWFYYFLVWFSVLFHEIGHLNAGIAYGYKVCSVGVLFFVFFPIGAYVSYNDKMNYNKTLTSKEKVQFSLSGIESNMLMAGLLILVSVVINSPLSYTLISVANINIIMAIFNSLPALGLDGEKALSAFFDIDSIFFSALKWMIFKFSRKKLLEQGFIGYICFAFFCFVLILQLFVILIIVLDIVTMIFLVFIGIF